MASERVASSATSSSAIDSSTISRAPAEHTCPIGQAKTGTGKTFGFGIPVVQRLGLDPAHGVKALIVVPTRELCVQVYEDIDMLDVGPQHQRRRHLRRQGVRGPDRAAQGRRADRRRHPRPPIDLNNQRLLDLSHATEVVLDEADKMLDLGFLPDIEKIFQKVPAVRHTQLFSATMPGPIVALARRFMTNPIHIRATDPDEGLTQANISHLVYRAHSLDKDEVIARILQADGRGKTVIFTRTPAAMRTAQRMPTPITVSGTVDARARRPEARCRKFRRSPPSRAGATTIRDGCLSCRA